MRLIDADALEKEGWSMHRTIQVDKNTSEYQTKQLKQVPTIELEPEWNEIIIQCDNCGHFVHAKRENVMARLKANWIPVTERLPKDGQDVLFCDIDEDIMLGYHVKGRPDTHFTQKGSWAEMKNVFAWMPLPEPYQAERITDE